MDVHMLIIRCGIIPSKLVCVLLPMLQALCSDTSRFLCGLCQLQTADEIKLYRSEKKDSPWRDRPISESLKLFSDMRRGLIDEGKATLRMKQDMQNENFNMYDLIAYRIKVMTLLSILKCVSCLWQM